MNRNIDIEAQGVISRKQFFQRIATPPTIKPAKSYRSISNAPPPSTASRTSSYQSQESFSSSNSNSSSIKLFGEQKEKERESKKGEQQKELVSQSSTENNRFKMSAGHNHKLKRKKSKKFGNEPPPRVDPPRDRDPPTLTDYLLHLFDGNKLRSISPNKLNDSQFFWLLNDLGLGLSDDEVSVLCRRAPQAADHKVDWESFAPRFVIYILDHLYIYN